MDYRISSNVQMYVVTFSDVGRDKGWFMTHILLYCTSIHSSSQTRVNLKNTLINKSITITFLPLTAHVSIEPSKAKFNNEVEILLC